MLWQIPILLFLILHLKKCFFFFFWFIGRGRGIVLIGSFSDSYSFLYSGTIFSRELVNKTIVWQEKIPALNNEKSIF